MTHPCSSYKFKKRPSLIVTLAPRGITPICGSTEGIVVYGRRSRGLPQRPLHFFDEVYLFKELPE